MTYDVEEVSSVLKNGGLISKYLPNYSQRKSQIDLAVAIYDSYQNGTNLVAEAPTGIGKSIAGLVPAILMAIKNKHKTMITTSTKALQMQYFEKDLPFLSSVFDGRFKYAMLKGRSNYLCLRRCSDYYNDFILTGKVENHNISMQYNRLLSWVKSTVTGDFEELNYDIMSELKSEICCNSDDCDGKKCKYDCFFKKAKRVARNSDIVLVNTDLFCADLVLRNKHNVSTLPNYDTVIIDEAHELEDIISKYIGFKISEMAFKKAVGFSMKYVHRIEKEYCTSSENLESIKLDISLMDDNARKLMKNASSFFDNFIFEIDNKNADTIRIDHSDFDAIVNIAGKKLTKSIDAYVDKLIHPNSYSSDDSLVEMYESVINQFGSISERLSHIMTLFDKDNDEFVYWVTYTKKGYNPIIECCPIDVSKVLNEWLFTRISGERWDMIKLSQENKMFEDCEDDDVKLPVKNVVLMSATMTTNKGFSFITNRLGIDDYDEIILPQSFDYAHNALLYIPKGLVEPNIGRNSDTFTLQLANNIIELSNVTEGKMLCLFTSYSEMQKVFDIVRPKVVGKYHLFNQNQYPKSELIKMFRNDVNSILFATSSFWTGVDFQGETLSALVIDRIPFPVPSEPIIEARIDKIKKQGGDWFNSYYIPMATMSMCQGFGRLIRTKTDMGIIMICDVRIITKPYGSKFLYSFPKTLKTRKIEKVKVFYDIVKKKRERRTKK